MKILVVDDDLALSDVIAFTLRRAGFTVITAHDGLAALDDWQQQNPALIVLDLRLPKLDGLTVCRRIRAQSDVPIIILSVQGEDEDIVNGLELGADDYITKPFSPRQLVARIKALFRRTGIVHSPGILTAAGLSLDTARREVQITNKEPVQLTQLECRLLEVLILNSGVVLPADALIERIWGAGNADRTMLKQLVHRLRQKIEPDTTEPVYIETIPGVGYALIDQTNDNSGD
jgi:DNA-binding response OmpR family regulator